MKERKEERKGEIKGKTRGSKVYGRRKETVEERKERLEKRNCMEREDGEK